MIRDFLWFQQDGATCHASRKPIQLLHESFPDRLISRIGDHQWPPWSCDLTPSDFFFGVLLNHWCMPINPETSATWRRKFDELSAKSKWKLVRAVIANFTDWVLACQRGRGGHMPDIIFHTWYEKVNWTCLCPFLMCVEKIKFTIWLIEIGALFEGLGVGQIAQPARRVDAGWTARVRSRVAEVWRFSSLFRVQSGPRVHSASYKMNTVDISWG